MAAAITADSLKPLMLGGATALYVTLRCMQLFKNHCRLYAGSGLLPDSSEPSEWQETETKLDTMRNLLRRPAAVSRF